MAFNIFQAQRGLAEDNQGAFDDSYARTSKVYNDVARRRAGAALASGDRAGAARALGNEGEVNAVRTLQADQADADQQAYTNQRQATQDQRATALAEAARKTDGLIRVVDMLKTAPEGNRLGSLQANMATLQGILPPQAMQQFAGVDESHLTNAALAPLEAALRKAKDDYTLGSVRYSGETNKPIAGMAELDPTKTYLAPDTGGPAPQLPAAPAPPNPQGPDTQPDPAVWDSVVQQESGHRPGVTGPMTPYGQAQGETQMLPATAQAMAQKLGIAWRPDLMTATTPEGEAYQLKLGEAYFKEGLDKYDGNVEKAVMYYHGGPDESLWGPKTHAYTKAVLQRAGRSTGGQAQPQPASQPEPAAPDIPGMRVIQRGGKQWRTLPDGRQENTITGKIEGSPADEDTPLSSDAVQLLAGKYLNNGTLPPMGAGKTGTRNRAMILNAATTQAKALGLDANDLVAGTVGVKAAGAALNKAVTLRAMTEGFEQTALKNAALMLSLAPKGGSQTNAPVLNRWLQAGRKQIAGDPDVSSFDVALGTFSDEYAKIMSGSAGGAPVSDASRREAYDRLSKYASQGQLKSGVEVMRKEMANRIGSMQDVEAGLRDTIRRGGQPSGLGSAPNIYAQPAAPGSPAPSAPMMRYDANGRQIK